MKLSLSYDWAEVTYKVAIAECQQKRQENLSLDGCYLVKIKWLGPDEAVSDGKDARSLGVLLRYQGINCLYTTFLAEYSRETLTETIAIETTRGSDLAMNS